MHPPRLSIAGLMALVAIAAIAVASLHMADSFGVDACRILTVAVLVWATIGARFGAGRGGGFWFGFALAGWASYLLVIDVQANPTRPSVFSWIPMRMSDAIGYGVATNTMADLERRFAQSLILHYMMVLPVACLGGLVGWLAARRRERADATDLPRNSPE
jgi:hypothetical protein